MSRGRRDTWSPEAGLGSLVALLLRGKQGVYTKLGEGSGHPLEAGAKDGSSSPQGRGSLKENKSPCLSEQAFERRYRRQGAAQRRVVWPGEAVSSALGALISLASRWWD